MENGWVVGIGAVNAFYHSGATISTGRQLIPGAPATVSNNLTLMFDVRRYITEDFSLSLMGWVPPEPTITGKRSVASLGELGKVRYRLAILTADYHLSMDAFGPDVGAGTAYAIILEEHHAAVPQLGARNNWGFVLKRVAQHPLSRNLAMFVDIKEMWLAVNAHDSLDGVVPVTANVNLNPTIVSVGIRLHLHRGYLSQ
jgi:outer membrane protein W